MNNNINYQANFVKKPITKQLSEYLKWITLIAINS